MYRQLISELRQHRSLIPIFVTLIIGITAWGVVPEMFEHEKEPDYYYFMMPYLFVCDPLEYPENEYGSSLRNPVKWWVNCLSYHVTGYSSTLPIVFNIALMPLVYLLAVELTKDRIIGLVALVAFVYNPIYQDWVGNGLYDQVWAFFLVLSIYLMYKFRFLGYSYSTYVIAMAAKGLAVMYLPIWFYSLWKTDRILWQKIVITVLTIASICAAFFIVNKLHWFVGSNIGFYPEHFEEALVRNISVLWQVIPTLILLVGLNTQFRTKNRVQNRKLVGLWMLGIILTIPIVHMFSEQHMYSYRFVPLAIFMSIYAGIVIVELGNAYVEWQLGKKSKKDAHPIKINR